MTYFSPTTFEKIVQSNNKFKDWTVLFYNYFVTVKEFKSTNKIHKRVYILTSIPFGDEILFLTEGHSGS